MRNLLTTIGAVGVVFALALGVWHAAHALTWLEFASVTTVVWAITFVLIQAARYGRRLEEARETWRNNVR